MHVRNLKGRKARLLTLNICVTVPKSEHQSTFARWSGPINIEEKLFTVTLPTVNRAGLYVRA
jgi:hypothetical protein